MTLVTAQDLVAAGLCRATAFRYVADAIARGTYPTREVETRTRTGARRMVTALEVPAEAAELLGVTRRAA